MVDDHFCNCGRKMGPVWKDGTEDSPLVKFVCERCLRWEDPRPGDPLTRREYLEGTRRGE